MKAGQIYKTIAYQYFENRYRNMPKESIDAVIVRGNLAEIEGYINATPYIDSAINALGRELERFGIYLPTDFRDIVYSSDTPNQDVTELNIAASQRIADDNKKALIAYRMLETVHNRWIQRHADKFFAPDFKDRQYLFMPTEIVGMDAMMSDYIFVQDIVILVGVRPEHRFLAETYRDARSGFRRWLGVDDHETLVNAIRQMRHRPLTEDIKAALSDKYIAEHIAGQVIQRNGLPDTW